MQWQAYRGERYLSMDEVEAWCEVAAATCPHVSLEVIGQSPHGRPIQLLTLGVAEDRTETTERPGFWLDGGTHASEWTAVMSVLYNLSRWIEALQAGDEALQQWLAKNAIFALPCVSPDGYQAMFDGAPFLRSSLRPPREGSHRIGLSPADVDGDGTIRWMRWRHPAGPFVPDEDVPMFMRPRTLDDDPQDAFFYCQEGTFLAWDGHCWTNAPREFGLDLNRNFPGSWKPSHMFGMDGGDFPLDAPESRAMMDAVAARPNIGAAISNHTYTGALLTQPYRPDSPLSDSDINLMEALANNAVQDTGYRVLRVHPAFTYNPKKPIGGVWSDTLTTVLGIPGYTLELWDPYAHCDVFIAEPAAFFRDPDLAVIKKMLAHFSKDPDAVAPWRSFEHPQLGEIELGGIDYMRTFRNPPIRLLAEECHKGFLVADRTRRALPQVHIDVQVTQLAAGLHQLTARLENVGFLSTASLAHTESMGLVAPPSIALQLTDENLSSECDTTQVLHHLDGWGQARAADLRHPMYPSLPQRGHRAIARWIVKGHGRVSLHWRAGRAGRGQFELTLPNQAT